MTEYLTERYLTQDEQRVLFLIESFPFATLIPFPAGRHFAFLPMIRDERHLDQVVLIGHVDSANPTLAQLDGTPADALFYGPNAYISPFDYESSQLPTWNYAVARVSGTSTLVHDEVEKLELMTRMVEALETSGGSTFRLDGSDRRVTSLIRRVTFLLLVAESVHGIFKYSQEKAVSDRTLMMRSMLAKLGAIQNRTIARLAEDVTEVGHVRIV